MSQPGSPRGAGGGGWGGRSPVGSPRGSPRTGLGRGEFLSGPADPRLALAPRQSSHSSSHALDVASNAQTTDDGHEESSTTGDVSDDLDHLRAPSEVGSDDDVSDPGVDVMTTSPSTLVYRSLPGLIALQALKYILVICLVVVLLGLDSKIMQGLQSYDHLAAERDMIYHSRVAGVLSGEFLERAQAVSARAVAAANGTNASGNGRETTDAATQSNTADVLRLNVEGSSVTGITEGWLAQTLRSPLLDPATPAAQRTPAALNDLMQRVGDKITAVSDLVLLDIERFLGTWATHDYYHMVNYMTHKMLEEGQTLAERGTSRAAREGSARLASTLHSTRLLLPDDDELVDVVAVFNARRATAAANIPNLPATPSACLSVVAVRHDDADACGSVSASLLTRFDQLIADSEADALDAVYSFDKERQVLNAGRVAQLVVAVVAVLFTTLTIHEEWALREHEARLRDGFAQGDETAKIIADFTQQVETCTRDAQRKSKKQDSLSIEGFFLTCIDALSILKPYIPAHVFKKPVVEHPKEAKEEVESLKDRESKVPVMTRGRAGGGALRTNLAVGLKALEKQREKEMAAGLNDTVSLSMSLRSGGSVSSRASSGSMRSCRSARSGVSAGSITRNVDTAMSRLLEGQANAPHLHLHTGLQKEASYTLCLLNTTGMHNLLNDPTATAATAQRLAHQFLALVVKTIHNLPDGCINAHNPMHTLVSTSRRASAAQAAFDIVTGFNGDHHNVACTHPVTAAVTSGKFKAGLMMSGIRSTWLFAGAGMLQLERFSRLTRVIATPILANGGIYRSLRIAKGRRQHTDLLLRPRSVVASGNNATMQLVYGLTSEGTADVRKALDIMAEAASEGSLHSARSGRSWTGRPRSASGTPQTPPPLPQRPAMSADQLRKREDARVVQYETVVKTALKNTERAFTLLHEYVKQHENPADVTVPTPCTPLTVYLWDFLKERVERGKHRDYYM